ncbi:MAG: hypothetical protein JWN14_4680 [Chthonomonadales bacterium]|nr:hypothetical protein [Chthonomonadales bacterium]
MQFKMGNMQKHAPLMAIACGLLSALGVGLVGCGGGSSNNGPGPDRSADFSLIVDPVSVNTVLQSGQTTPITLDLVSANGFPHPVTLSSDGTGFGFSRTVFTTPTLSSLPKGVTKVVLNVTVPPGTGPRVSRLISIVSAAGGGVTRPLNSGVFNTLRSGELHIAIEGSALNISNLPPFYTPFLPNAFDNSQLIARVPFVSVGHSGPITVTLTNPNPNVTATLDTSTFNPVGPTHALEYQVSIDMHADLTLPAGTYPFTLTATAGDGAKLITTLNLYIVSAAFVGTPPTLTVAKNGGAAASVDADLVIHGPPGLPVDFTAPAPQQNITLTVTPNTATIPASGTLTQHVTLAVTLPFGSFPATYSIPLRVSGGSRLSQPAAFTLKVQ